MTLLTPADAFLKRTLSS